MTDYNAMNDELPFSPSSSVKSDMKATPGVVEETRCLGNGGEGQYRHVTSYYGYKQSAGPESVNNTSPTKWSLLPPNLINHMLLQTPNKATASTSDPHAYISLSDGGELTVQPPQKKMNIKAGPFTYSNSNINNPSIVMQPSRVEASEVREYERIYR